MEYEIRVGNVFDELPKIPSESIDLCITSPPFWGLRDYGVDGQLGLEPTMEEYLENTLRWVKEVWRVLKPSGSFVLNIGDCYFGSGGRGGRGIESLHRGVQRPLWRKMRENKYKPKQMLSVSSFAYCKIVSETDFVCRNESIWCKPNVPSPIRSRLKHSHEKLFWFVKDADKYYFDAKVWLKPINSSSIKRAERAMLTTRLQGAFARGGAFAPNTPGVRENIRKEGRELNYPKNSLTIENSWCIVPVGEKQKGFEIEQREMQLHVAPYPEALIKPWVESLCPPQGMVLDPFLGSGTTMKVARDLHRSCIGIELNPKYAEYAEKRCGLKAIKLMQEAMAIGEGA